MTRQPSVNVKGPANPLDDSALNFGYTAAVDRAEPAASVYNLRGSKTTQRKRDSKAASKVASQKKINFSARKAAKVMNFGRWSESELEAYYDGILAYGKNYTKVAE